MIEINNFSKDYNLISHKKSGFSVKDISMEIRPGKITALLGPNGSGKTTIMKAVCGFHYPSAGQIFLSDNDGNRINVAEKPECAADFIGYVPEQSVLPPEMKVIEFLRYAGELHRLSGDKLTASIEAVVEKCSLGDVLDKKIKKLSKGYQQRVSFAQAVIHNPPNLILDEAITGLDPAQILQMREIIINLSKTCSILMSTHILQEVRSLCDSLYIMSNGKITASGTEEEITKKAGTKSLEEAFIKLTQGVSE